LCGAESPPKLILMTIDRFARFGINASTSSQRGQYQSVEKPGREGDQELRQEGHTNSHPDCSHFPAPKKTEAGSQSSKKRITPCKH